MASTVDIISASFLWGCWNLTHPSMKGAKVRQQQSLPATTASAPKATGTCTESRQSWSPSLGARQWTDTFCLQRPTWRQMFCFSVFVSSSLHLTWSPRRDCQVDTCESSRVGALPQRTQPSGVGRGICGSVAGSLVHGPIL